MAPSNHVRHITGMARDKVHTEADPSPKTILKRQNDNSGDRDRSGRSGGDRGGSRFGSGRGGGGDEGNTRGGRGGGGSSGDTNTGGRNDKDSSRGDRSNRNGGGRGFFGGRRFGDNDRNGDSSNSDRGRGSGRTDNDVGNRSRPPAASSGTPTPPRTLSSSAGPSQPPPVASVTLSLGRANPVNNAGSASSGRAGGALPASGNTPSIVTTNPSPTPVILLSTVLPDFVNTIPLTTALPSASAFPTGTAALQLSGSAAVPISTPSPELENAINPVGGTGAGSRNSPNAQTQNPDGAPAQQQQEESQQQNVSMDVTTERVLISIGSIGSFVIICFVIWMIRRTAKKAKQRGQSNSSAKTPRGGSSAEAPAFYHKIAASIPFLKNHRQTSWQKVDEKEAQSVSSNHSVATSTTPAATSGTPVSAGGVYRNEKVNQPLPTLPRLQTRMSFLPQQHMNMSPAMMGISPAGIGMSPGANSHSPARSSMNTPQISQLPYDLSGLGTGKFGESTVSSHQANDSFSSTNAAAFGGTFTSTGGADGNLKPAMLSPDYNRNELSREAYGAYNSMRRQDNHTSMLSSLSSGFGDGDIIVVDQPQPPMPQVPTAAQLSYMQTQAQSSEQYDGTSSRTSWMSRSNRDTVYTQASEDSPPRFRTVSSWVNQQTRRVRRAEQRDNGQVPPVPGMAEPGWHDMPPEPQFNMMMDDGQAPRAPGSVLGR